jgi:WD40 repeat protein
MRFGELGWQADLETMYGLVGKVRALAFGQIDSQPVVAIGIDHSIRLWDPRRGQEGERVLGNDGRRLTAVALSQLNGRPVVVAVSSYDQIVVIRDVRSGTIAGPAMEVGDYLTSIALGLYGDREAVAATGNRGLVAWDAHTGVQLSDLPASLVQDRVLGVSELNGKLVAHVVRPLSGECGAFVVDIATGIDVWTTPQWLPQVPALIAAGHTQGGHAVAASFKDGSIVSWLAGHPVGYPSVIKNPDGVDVRALAVGEVQGMSIVVHTPDYDQTALVSLTVASSTSETEASDELHPIQWKLDQGLHGVFAMQASQVDKDITARLAVLTDAPLTVFELEDGEPIDRAPSSATVTFALTGTQRSDVDFRSKPASTLAQPPPLAARTSSDAPFRVGQPKTWPRSAQCRGIVADRAVIATGSIAGSVWIWDAVTQSAIAGPFTDVPEHKGVQAWSSRALRMKGGPSLTSSVALGRHPHHGDVLAVAHEGSIRLLAVPSGTAIPTPASKATVVTALALGRMLGEDVLVTGSQGGAVIVWALASNKRIAALTLDSSVERVWVVHGADAIAVQTMHKGDHCLFILDIRPGRSPLG